MLFSEAQQAELREIFPTGVWDYRKPAVDFSRTVPWLTYADGPGGSRACSVTCARPRR